MPGPATAAGGAGPAAGTRRRLIGFRLRADDGNLVGGLPAGHPRDPPEGR